MIDRHTLVIPTYNRPALLNRLVQYYCKRARPMNLLVLDSSRPEVAQENAKSLSFYGESLRHVVFPGTTPVAAKLLQGLALVQTPYVSFCADDDLVFPDGLREAIAFLQDHPDYICAHGRYLNFLVKRHHVHVWLEYAGPGNEAAHPGARIFRLLQNYESLFYGLFRTHDLRDIFAGVVTLPTLHYQELFQSVAALIKGKVRRFPKLYAARQSCPPAEPDRDQWQTYYWFADNPGEMIEHYRAYCDALWKLYEVHGPAPRLERELFFKTLDLAHAVYFSAGCPPHYFHSVLQPYWPDDPYVDLGKLRLFERLGIPPNAPPLRLMKAWMWVRLAREALRAPLGKRRLMRHLNLQARDTYRTPWKCRLPLRFRSLILDADFRNAYLELCHYLDQS